MLKDCIGGKLGEGEFGVVYLGTFLQQWDSPFKKVAIKTIKPEFSSETLKSFMNEINVMNFIGAHPNIVSLLGSCIEDVPNGNTLLTKVTRDIQMSKRYYFI